MIDLAIRHLIKEEDIKLEPYKDHLGYWTIGVGHLIDCRKGGSIPIGVHCFPISEHLARQILNDDIHGVHTDLSMSLNYWRSLSKVRQVCLISMAFQMGVKGVLGFKKALKFIREGEFDKAAIEMLDSRWADQTPNRARRISMAMETDREEYLC
jgi:lysozyme